MTGVLLMNLGTPDAPTVPAVRRYLKQFLSDPRVLDGPAWKRRLILHLFILPRRPKRSAAAYRRIWTREGSPILFHSRSLLRKVQERLPAGAVAALGMRYGSPSIAGGLEELLARGADRLVLFPLYPQYSAATTGSCLAEAYRFLATVRDTPPVTVVPPFYNREAWLIPQAESARKLLKQDPPDHVFFSFHGLPEHQVLASDRTGATCLKKDGCCDDPANADAGCYRAQCFATARALAGLLNLPEAKFTVSFQSRLGKTVWIRPYTDVELKRRAESGERNAVILSPAFVADCLETLDELGNEGTATWKAAGGGRLDLVPCVNDDDTWADGVVRLALGAGNASARGSGHPSTKEGKIS